MLVGKVRRIVSPFDSFNHQLERLSNYSDHSTCPVLVIKHGKMIIGIPNACELEKKRKTRRPHQPTLDPWKKWGIKHKGLLYVTIPNKNQDLGLPTKNNTSNTRGIL